MEFESGAPLERAEREIGVLPAESVRLIQPAEVFEESTRERGVAERVPRVGLRYNAASCKPIEHFRVQGVCLGSTLDESVLGKLTRQNLEPIGRGPTVIVSECDLRGRRRPPSEISLRGRSRAAFVPEEPNREPGWGLSIRSLLITISYDDDLESIRWERLPGEGFEGR